MIVQLFADHVFVKIAQKRVLLNQWCRISCPGNVYCQTIENGMIESEVWS
jgi:hypothetical protein